MNSFRLWYIRDRLKITWFLATLLIASGLSRLARNNLIGMAINFGLTIINFGFTSIRSR